MPVESVPTIQRSVKSVVFPVVMYRCESWTIKAPEYQYWCFWTEVLEKTIESPLDSKIKPVNPKGDQSWIFIGRTGAEAEAPILWPPDVKSQLIRKDLTLGKIEGKRKKGMAENKIVEWHHWLKEHEFKQAPGDGEGQGSLACCRPWGHKESDTTKRLSNNNNTIYGLPWWLRWWRICPPCRRLKFDSWVGKISLRRKWLPTPVFLPGQSHGQRSLVGYKGGHKELDMNEQLAFSLSSL